jgi:hypothetical protein
MPGARRGVAIASSAAAAHGANHCAALLSQLQGQADTSSAAAASKKPPAGSSSSSSRAAPAPAPAANGHVQSFDVAAPDATATRPPGSSAWQVPQQQQQQQPQAASASNEPDPSTNSSSSYKQSKFDSLDYEVVENTVYRTDAAGRTHLDHIMESGAKWTICFTLGKSGRTPAAACCGPGCC